MNHFSFIPIYENGEKGDPVSFTFPELMSEITFQKKTDYELLVQEQPDFIKDLFGKTAEIVRNLQSDWTPQMWGDFFTMQMKVVEVFSGLNFNEVREIPLIPEDNKGLFSIATLCRQVIKIMESYQPSERDRFVHKGVTYLIPEKNVFTIEDIVQVNFGKNLKSGEVVEALYRAKMYQTKTEEGDFLLSKRKYLTEMGMIASMCRRVEPDGSTEKIPLGIGNYAEFVEARMEELKDLPADVAEDCSFFLLNFLRRSIRTHTQRKSSGNVKQETRRKKRLGSNLKKRGKNGAGITSFLRWLK